LEVVTIGWQRALVRLLSAGERVVRVTGVEDLLPSYRRVHLLAPGFLRELAPHPTTSVRLRVPDVRTSTLRQRSCTVVDPDLRSGTFALDVVLHEPAGPAGRWAQHVAGGDVVEMTAARGHLALDPTLTTSVLVGDLSSLAAVNSVLLALPPRARTHVVLVGTPGTAAHVRRRPGTTVDVVRDEAEQLACLGALEPDRDDCFLWAAGERHQVDAVAALARRGWRLPPQRCHAERYWVRSRSSARVDAAVRGDATSGSAMPA
jgi:ATP-binding cassette subfamily B protein IrtA